MISDLILTLSGSTIDCPTWFVCFDSCLARPGALRWPGTADFSDACACVSVGARTCAWGGPAGAGTGTV